MDEAIVEHYWQSSVVWLGGVAEATPSLWVIVSVDGRHPRHLFMPSHVGNCILYLGIWAVIPRRALFWQKLWWHDNHCTKVACGPEEFL